MKKGQTKTSSAAAEVCTTKHLGFSDDNDDIDDDGQEHFGSGLVHLSNHVRLAGSGLAMI